MMVPEIKYRFNKQQIRQFFIAQNIGLFIFGLIVLAIAWSGAKTVQNNYELQKKIATLNQQNEVLELENANTMLQNQFYKTDEYLELSARQNLGLVAPGEQILIVPKDVALKFVDNSLKSPPPANSSITDDRPGYVKNLEAWRDFLIGRDVQ